MRIIVGIEEQASGRKTAAFLKEHTWPADTEILLLNMVSPVMYDSSFASYPVFLESTWEQIQDEGEHLLRQTRALLLGTPNIKEIYTSVRIGYPDQIILQTAKEWNADLIVVGCHGRHGISKLLLGSVSEGIAAHAPCSVVILRLQPETEEKATEQTASKQTKQLV